MHYDSFTCLFLSSYFNYSGLSQLIAQYQKVTALCSSFIHMHSVTCCCLIHIHSFYASDSLPYFRNFCTEQGTCICMHLLLKEVYFTSDCNGDWTPVVRVSPSLPYFPSTGDQRSSLRFLCMYFPMYVVLP